MMEAEVAADAFMEEAVFETAPEVARAGVDEGAQLLTKETVVQQAEVVVDAAMEEAAPEVARAVVDEGAQVLTKETIVQQVIVEPSLWNNIAFWFFLGAIFSIGLYLLVEKIRKK